MTGTNRPARPGAEPSEAYSFLPEGGVPNHPEVYKGHFLEAIGTTDLLARFIEQGHTEGQKKALGAFRCWLRSR